MGLIATEANSVYRDYNTDGISASGFKEADKSEIRDLFGTIEDMIFEGIPNVRAFGAVGSGTETDEFVSAAAAYDAIFVPDGSYTASLTEAQLQKFWGPGQITSDGDLEARKFTIPMGVYIPKGARDGSADDIVNLPTASAALEIHNRKDNPGGAIDIFNKGDFASGTSATAGITLHHYTDGIGMQIDNVGVNAAMVIKAARNDTKRPDKGADWVATGAFMIFTRSGYESEGNVGNNVTTFTRTGGIKFEDDEMITDYRTIESVGSQRIKIKSAGGILWLECGAYNAGDTLLNHILVAGPVRLNQINGGSGYTAAQTTYMLYRQGVDLYWSTGSVATKLN